jgi:hypothetical protein
MQRERMRKRLLAKKPRRCRLRFETVGEAIQWLLKNGARPAKGRPELTVPAVGLKKLGALGYLRQHKIPVQIRDSKATVYLKQSDLAQLAPSHS